jgi:hypothetical protein
MNARLAMTLAALAASSACLPRKGEEGDVNGARDALPRAESLRVNVPEGGANKPAGVGQTSDLYALTRATAGTLNGGAAVVLVVVRAVTLLPPTSVDGDAYVWGPWDGNALQPSQYRLVVRAEEDGDYAWSLEGRRKHTAGEFKMVISGVATPGEPGRGSGTLTMDFNVAEALDPIGNRGEGVLSLTYDLETEPATLHIDWEGLAGHTVSYDYSEGRDGSGTFDFVNFEDTDDAGTAFETLEISSKWKASGAGRSDAHISGGDLGAARHQVTECWNTSYAVTYHIDTVGWQGIQGDASSCVF